MLFFRSCPCQTDRTCILRNISNVSSVSTNMVSADKSRRRMQALKRLRRFGIAKRTPTASRKRYPLSRKSWQEHVAELRPGEFQRRYRMPESKFNWLLAECAIANAFFRPATGKQEYLHLNLFNCAPIDPRHKLAAALRWCAGGSHLDIRLVHGMSMKQ